MTGDPVAMLRMELKDVQISEDPSYTPGIEPHEVETQKECTEAIS